LITSLTIGEDTFGSFIDEPLGWSEIELSGRRVASIAAARDSGDTRLNDGVQIIAGMSSTRQGIDPQMVNKVSGSHWIVFGGSGGTLLKLQSFLDPLIRSRLIPHEVVLCIHPCWLVSSGKRDLYDLERQFDGEPQIHFYSRLRNCFWFSRHRVVLNHAWRTMQYQLKWVAIKQLSIRDSAAWQPLEDPFLPRSLLDLPAQISPKQLDTQFKKQFRYRCEPMSYKDSCLEQQNSLIDLIQSLQTKGVRVIVVLMPEREGLRIRVPEEADRLLFSVLDKQRRYSEIQFWDARSLLPDDCFSDYIHLNDVGRAEFSRLLGERIAMENNNGQKN